MFRRRLNWISTCLNECRGDWEKLERQQRPLGQLDARTRDSFQNSLGELRGHLADLGLVVPGLPLVHRDLLIWVEFLTELREYATRSDVDGAIEWARKWKLERTIEQLTK